jgi:dTDP-4-amino-4,6-dideoxygalactose transaminase
MNQIIIDFNRPTMVGNELEYIAQAFGRSHISGDGYFTKRCQELLQDELGIPKILLTTSCTHALEMAALLLDIKPGDEIIVPSFTFVSTVNAFILRGATPVFIDIRPDTLNLNETLLTNLITPHTAAILPVHYAGVACEMDTIMHIAQKYDISIVEDNAHGLFGRYKDKNLGTFGKMATQSFHETKNLTCGEGGALLINDPALVERAEIIREKGTDRSRFFRGMVDKYTWVDVGSSYLPSDILGAILLAQLEARQKIQKKRQALWEYYYTQLTGWAISHNVGLPFVPDECEQPFHMFYLLLPTLDTRQNLIAYLKERGIISVFHYLPLHLSEMGQRYGYQIGDCPITEQVSDRLLRLPFHNALTTSDQDQVIENIIQFPL